ncbi:glycosyltransferase family 1 protein [Algibacter miyuki]|uniref:Glycosyltransferase family 1 protein n=1 Tax=Algibacter miyuki TaxID=1306933 RepID=A0ABV5GYC8_9FLAO|nr:glycosyltransferase family 1 protein [Algibacter miyuki]MDN3667155.1 glycosyltransferase family 1 protein [Algibacter miyuki]
MNRILHIVGKMNRAGAETMIMNLYRKLDRTKFQFDFIYFTNETCDYDQEIETLGGRIFRVSGSNPITRTKALYTLLKKEAPFHAVQCHQMFSNGLHLIAANYAGVKMRISHSHNTSDANSDKLIGKIYHSLSKLLIKKYSTHFIACGDAAGKFLFPNVENVMLLPNAVNLDKFLNSPKANAGQVFNNPSITNETFVICQIGRLNEVKNHEFSVKLAQFLKKKGIDFQLIIVGGGPLETKIKAQVSDLKLTDCITFTGVRSDIETVLANANLMLMPSYFEGFPVVLVESQVSGIPALISSSISKEVDMGLGLIHFCDLEDDLSIWFDKIKEIRTIKLPTPQKRYDVLSQAGYNIELSIKKLQHFYENI